MLPDRIRMHPEPGAVMPAQHVKHQASHHMVAKVGRQIADADRRRSVRTRWCEIHDTRPLFLAQPIMSFIQALECRARHVEILRVRRGGTRIVCLTAPVWPVDRQGHILVLVLRAGRDAR